MRIGNTEIDDSRVVRKKGRLRPDRRRKWQKSLTGCAKQSQPQKKKGGK